MQQDKQISIKEFWKCSFVIEIFPNVLDHGCIPDVSGLKVNVWLFHPKTAVDLIIRPS